MKYCVEDMLYLMKQLRDPDNGCPWDIEQSPEDIINYSIEEVYELADSVESGNFQAIKDELGDVLFQVVFLSRIAEEREHFCFNDVVSACVSKLVRRHPHVFPNGELYGSPDEEKFSIDVTTADVKKNWEIIKQQERVDKKQMSLFDDVPNNLPALNRSAKLQKRAASIGLDWQDSTGPLKKVREEIEELELAQRGKQIAKIQDEVGDLLFAVVNFCRKAGISPEQALRKSNNKFISRVNAVQNLLKALPEETIRMKPRQELLDELWEEVKSSENGREPDWPA